MQIYNLCRLTEMYAEANMISDLTKRDEILSTETSSTIGPNIEYQYQYLIP